MNAPLPAEILSPRLRLRRPVMADADAIFESYAQDPQVTRFLIWAPHASISESSEFIASCMDAWKAGGRRPYVITRRDADRAIGMIEARFLGTSVDIGYILARQNWGAGLMPEALRALTDAALSSPGIFRVHAAVDTDNTGSQRTLEKAGFVREGRLERYSVHPNLSPEPRACLMYSRCR